jgi:hypothetical protein
VVGPWAGTMNVTLGCTEMLLLLLCFLAVVVNSSYIRRMDGVNVNAANDGEGNEPYWFWDFSESSCAEHKIWGEATNEMYGSSVSIWDNLMIVGAQGDLSGKYESGAAYVYFKYGSENADWKLFYTLEPEDGADGDRFGCAVSLSEYTAVIGASKNDVMGQDSGAAYLYERNVNKEKAQNAEFNTESYNDQSHLNFVMKLVAEDGSGQDYFGSAVATYDDTAVVGAWGCDEAGTLAGCVYVWRKFSEDGSEGQWTFKQKVIANDATGYQRFGSSVSVFGELIVVGAPGATDTLGSEVGAVYVFDKMYDDTEYDGRAWKQQVKLTPSDGGHYDLYGQSVSLWEDSILVGAPQHYVTGKKGARIKNAGTVYSYAYNADKQFFLVEEIEPLYPIEDGHFGYSVDIYNRMAAVGEFREGLSGSVYVFREEEKEVYSTTVGHWIFDAQRKSSQEMPGDMYGYAVSIYDANLAVGAYGASLAFEDPDGNSGLYSNGGVYLYTGVYSNLPAEPEQQEQDLDKTLVILVSCMVIVGVSCIAIICMYLDFKNGLARNIDSIQYELATLDSSHGGSPSALYAPSKHGYPGSTVGGSRAINPLHVSPSMRPLDSMDVSAGRGYLDASISSPNGSVKRSSSSSYGPAQNTMDASIRQGSRVHSSGASSIQ